MNTRLIKNMNESINEQEMRIEALMQEQEALQAQYEFVSSDEEVLRKAAEMGMVRA
jgi:DNA repair exonuclease SbcCD ATPase subunit